MTIRCFKAYDIRGRLGDTLDEDISRRVGTGFARAMTPRSVVLGHDARPTSPALAEALAAGLRAEGVDVIDIGLCGTEEVYFAVPHLGADGGIMVTASHNPIDYNGMKLVGPGSRPIDPVTELAQIRAAAEAADAAPRPARGSVTQTDTRPAYAAHLAGLVDAPRLGPLKVVADAGNGTAGAALDAVLDRLAEAGAQIDVVRIRHMPDPTFPHGIPNPMLPDNRSFTSDAVREAGADLGIAWDGDFDRCFFYDSAGAFLDGEYVVALLARAFLAQKAGARIVHDPRVIWATEAAVAEAGGTAVRARTGHAFLKAAMRESGAIYGGEMSAHHYFRDFFFCDSGIIPALKVMELISTTGRPLSDLVSEMQARFPSSGEINFEVADPKAAIAAVVAELGAQAQDIDTLDGASLDFGQWRMNLRASNTEPLLRLNMETRGDRALLRQKLAEVTALIETV